MKNKILKTLIVANIVYFGLGCFNTYRYWANDFFRKSVMLDNSIKTSFNRFMDSALVEEFGIISYGIALVLFVFSFTIKVRLKQLWLVLSVVPLLVAVLLIGYMKFH